jgi:hypothetical protein
MDAVIFILGIIFGLLVYRMGQAFDEAFTKARKYDQVMNDDAKKDY